MTHERMLYRIRTLIRQRKFIVTAHAEEELEVDGLTILDVESIIFSGVIVVRQTDRSTHEKKYVFQGLSLRDETCGLVAKLGLSGKVVIITVYTGTEVRYDV